MSDSQIPTTSRKRVWLPWTIAAFFAVITVLQSAVIAYLVYRSFIPQRNIVADSGAVVIPVAPNRSERMPPIPPNKIPRPRLAPDRQPTLPPDSRDPLRLDLSEDDLFSSLGTADPFAEMQKMRERMNRMLDRNLEQLPGNGSDPFSFAGSGLSLQEEDDRYVATMPMEEADDAEINIEVQNGMLTVKTSSKSGSSSGNSSGFGSQSFRSESQTSVSLPGPVDESKWNPRWWTAN